MTAARLTTVLIRESRQLARVVFSPRAYLWPKLAVAFGLSYVFWPLDLIADRLPVVGHVDEFGFIFGGFVLARYLGAAELQALPAAAPARLGPMPNFFIVGAARAGTTSLFNALGRHPDVFACPVKEPNWFCFDLSADAARVAEARAQGFLIDAATAGLGHLRVGLTVDPVGYRRLFAGWAGQAAIGEASTTYLPSTVAARAIAEAAPDARIIVVLRDPVARAWSDYLMNRQIGWRLASFRAEAEAEIARIARHGPQPRGLVSASLYAAPLRRFLDVWPRERVLVVLFDELRADPAGSLAKALRHLGIEAAAAGRVDQDNRSREPRLAGLHRRLLDSGRTWRLLGRLPRPVRRLGARLLYRRPPPAPPPADAAWLRAFFRADIAETSRLIGRDLAHWQGG